MSCYAAVQVSSEFFMREVLGMDREWGVLAWDVAGRGISYMLLEAFGYLCMVSLVMCSPISALLTLGLCFCDTFLLLSPASRRCRGNGCLYQPALAEPLGQAKSESTLDSVKPFSPKHTKEFPHDRLQRCHTTRTGSSNKPFSDEIAVKCTLPCGKLKQRRN